MAGYVADCCRLRRARRKGVSLRSRACRALALRPMDREARRRERGLQQVEARLCPTIQWERAKPCAATTRTWSQSGRG